LLSTPSDVDLKRADLGMLVREIDETIQFLAPDQEIRLALVTKSRTRSPVSAPQEVIDRQNPIGSNSQATLSVPCAAIVALNGAMFITVGRTVESPFSAPYRDDAVVLWPAATSGDESDERDQQRGPGRGEGDHPLDLAVRRFDELGAQRLHLTAQLDAESVNRVVEVGLGGDFVPGDRW
jgi:hypothetical protein